MPGGARFATMATDHDFLRDDIWLRTGSTRPRRDGVKSPQETSGMNRMSSFRRLEICRGGRPSTMRAYAPWLSRTIPKKVYSNPIFSVSDKVIDQVDMVYAMTVPACVMSSDAQLSSINNQGMKFFSHLPATAGCSLAADVRIAESEGDESLCAREVTLSEMVGCEARPAFSPYSESVVA
jgi:hypothetical protein